MTFLELALANATECPDCAIPWDDDASSHDPNCSYVGHIDLYEELYETSRLLRGRYRHELNGDWMKAWSGWCDVLNRIERSRGERV